jgi:hypothetical protein
MGLIDWIKQERNSKKTTPEGNVTKRCTPSFERLAAEIKQDREMAKERDETGKEPECRPLDIKPLDRKASPKRAKTHDHDVPF